MLGICSKERVMERTEVTWQPLGPPGGETAGWLHPSVDLLQVPLSRAFASSSLLES